MHAFPPGHGRREETEESNRAAEGNHAQATEGEEEAREAGGEEEEDEDEDEVEEGQENEDGEGEGRPVRAGAIADRSESRAYSSFTHKCEVRK